MRGLPVKRVGALYIFVLSFFCSALKSPILSFSNRGKERKPFSRFSSLFFILLFDRATGILPFSNRDGKGKCKASGRTPSFLPSRSFL